MSAPEFPSILAATKRADCKQRLPLSEWAGDHINAFHCNFVGGNSADLALSSDTEAGFQISHAAFSMSKYPYQRREPYNHVTQALDTAISSYGQDEIIVSRYLMLFLLASSRVRYVCCGIIISFI